MIMAYQKRSTPHGVTVASRKASVASNHKTATALQSGRPERPLHIHEQAHADVTGLIKLVFAAK
ncbi:hypothetical protein RvY_18973 [Ramazzottius varieornatus]|uniref:Uncharacterized protein n=1 Tax=Ramazzottius varieornatus TaxID=947166 RepID=A0A1D1W7R6_RAMVA|nr:hypothetical protein RvY_18973 [Ramazzottius varieornatus]